MRTPVVYKRWCSSSQHTRRLSCSGRHRLRDFTPGDGLGVEGREQNLSLGETGEGLEDREERKKAATELGREVRQVLPAGTYRVRRLVGGWRREEGVGRRELGSGVKQGVPSWPRVGQRPGARTAEESHQVERMGWRQREASTRS